ncbi:MAG: hypothetical protein Q3969_06615 [Moraxella sp.]|nr:antibiotic biosynthesis monooxygenase [Moraxella sp.]MDO4895192.1 hypothetical protein [Moraxella sp.]
MDEFHRLDRHNISQSVNTEQEVLAMYVFADKQMPNKPYAVEAYANERAYQARRQTPHFQAWLNGSKDMIISRKMINTLPMVFSSKVVAP